MQAPSESRAARIEPTWQAELARAVRDPDELIRRLELDSSLLPAARRAAKLFALRVPHPYLARIQPGDPDDPLLRQVLPLNAEHTAARGFAEDPVGDRASLQPGGVIHKYHGRVLLIATGACAINCRYCFRRHFPYSEANASRGDWRPALDYIATRQEITEVILSGGDPLVLPDERLLELIQRLGEIPHLQRLRIHSRLPVVVPSRVTAELTEALHKSRLRTVMVIHANHAHELTSQVGAAAGALQQRGVILLNQAVLLAGVNDTAPTLAALCERAFDHGILPYYLHLLDPVKGAAHFHVTEQRAYSLMRALARSVPGYLVPRLARERAGEPAKVWADWGLPSAP